MFVGVSFRTSAIQYLSKIYANSLFVHRSCYENGTIEDYNPDIVVFETVERYSSSLMETKKLLD